LNICNIFELQDGKIKRTRAYFGDPFEAPEWRARWVERM
jgi:limonene-1,2-epoxide hydrolase